MFNNECLGPLDYEAVTAAIAMAGLFLSFLVEYLGHRLVKARKAGAGTSDDNANGKNVTSTEMLSIYVMEAGIIFHSLSMYFTPFSHPNPSPLPPLFLYLFVNLYLFVSDW